MKYRSLVKPIIMRCRNCISFVDTGFCELFRKFTKENRYCLYHNWNTDEPLDPTNIIEFGVDIDLQEDDTLNGDDERVWEPTVKYKGR